MIPSLILKNSLGSEQEVTNYLSSQAVKWEDSWKAIY